MESEKWFKFILAVQIFMIPIFIFATLLHITNGEWFMGTLTSILVLGHCYIANSKLKKLTLKKD